MPEDWVAAKLRRLEDRFAIQDLVAAYCSAIDERDLSRFVALFTQDALLYHRDGAMRLQGRSEIETYYRGRFAGYGFTFHYPHAVSVTFDEDADRASGMVTGHAEMSVDGELLLASIRYSDRYRREAGSWRFAERELAFGYYMKLADLPLGFRDRLRKHYRGRRLAAEWPAEE